MKSKGTVGTSLTKVKEAILFRRFLGASVVGMAIFVLAFVAVPYLIAEANAANVASVGVSWNEVSLTLDPDYGNGNIGDLGHGDVQFGEIVPTSIADGNIGTMRVIKKNIGIITNGQYYSVYLSMKGNTQDLTMEGSTLSIEPIEAYWNGANDGDDDTDAPSAFAETSWGFAVPTGDGTTTLATPFVYNYGAYDSVLATDLTKTSHASIYNAATWAQVPAANDNAGPLQIWKETCTNTTTRTCSATGFGTATFPVYYGIMVDTDVMAGTYDNEIVYTAMASSASLDTVSTNINRSTEFVSAGTVETLSVDLSSSGVPLTRSDVEIYLIPHSVAAANNYTSTTGFDTYKVSANECVVGSQASDFVTTSHGLTLNCTLPATGSPNGIDDGTDSTHASETSSGVQLGEFDLWLHVKNYNYDYISKYTRNTSPVASIVYAGLQSKDASGNAYITKMQEMTQTVCSQTNEWGTTLGANAVLYDYNGMNATTPTSLGTGATADTLGLGTFALTDTRDSKDYLVRRLADGNCWMVQNLDLELADFAGKNDTNGGLTPANTDLAELGAAYWDPSESTIAKMQANGAATFGEFLNLMTGTGTSGNPVTNSEQFQSYDIANGSHFWGTKCTADGVNVQTYGTCDYAATVGNNGTSVIPRSYSNMVTSDGSTDFSKATQFRYVATNWETGKTRSQNMSGTTGYPTGAPSAFGTGAADTVTSTATYIPATKASSATGSAGAAYEAAADGSYYGTMYIGHYYNWYAATAETGNYSTTKPKNASICPAGWRLPVNAGYTSTTSGSWGNLLGTHVYNLLSGEGDQSRSESQGAAFGAAADMHKLPLSIPFTGYYYYQTGNLNDRGTYGYFWSSTPYSAPNARYLYFNSTTVYPQNYANKVSGLAVRCVAR